MWDACTQVTEALDKQYPARYGFGAYLERGAIFPGASLLSDPAPLTGGWGDCDCVASHVQGRLADAGVPPTSLSIWLINIPHAGCESGPGPYRMQHTIPVVEHAGHTHLLGYTPYDFLVNSGKCGVYRREDYAGGLLSSPGAFRGAVATGEHRALLLQHKVKPASIDWNPAGRCPIEVWELSPQCADRVGWPDAGAEDGHHPVVVLKTICDASMGGGTVMGFDTTEQVFTEMSALVGRRADETIIGFRISLFKDAWDPERRMLQTTAAKTLFIVLSAVDLGPIQSALAGWDPEETLGRLEAGDDGPGCEVRVEKTHSEEALKSAYPAASRHLHNAMCRCYGRTLGATGLTHEEAWRLITAHDGPRK